MKRFSLNNNKAQLIAVPVNKKDNEMSWIQEILDILNKQKERSMKKVKA